MWELLVSKLVLSFAYVAVVAVTVLVMRRVARLAAMAWRQSRALPVHVRWMSAEKKALRLGAARRCSQCHSVVSGRSEVCPACGKPK